MKSFDDFLAYTADSGRDDEIANATSELVAEALKSGGLSALNDEQIKAVYQLVVLVSGSITLSMLESYHEWAGGE